MKLKTAFEPKQSLNHNFDWSAVDEDCGEGLQICIGYGATEREAIADLYAMIEEFKIAAQAKPSEDA